MPIELRDPATGKIKPVVLASGAGILVIGFILLRKGGGGVSANGQSSGLTGLLSDLNSGLTLNVAGDASLTLDFVLMPNETINERFPEFSTVTVIAAGAWRWYVRSGRVT